MIQIRANASSAGWEVKLSFLEPTLGGCGTHTRKGNSSSLRSSVPQPTNFDWVQLRPTHSPSLQPHTHNVRLDGHPTHPDRNIPTKSYPPLRIGRRNPSSWRRGSRERGPKCSRLTQLWCCRCFDQDRWDDWVLWYVPSPFRVYPRAE